MTHSASVLISCWLLQTCESTAETSETIMSEAQDLSKLSISTLKQKLASRNLDVTGKKSDLVTRLEKNDRGRNTTYWLDKHVMN